MDSTLRPLAALLPLLLIPVACSDDGGADTTSSTETSTSGDGDGDSSSTETGTASGDGDGDMTTSGDGDGDPATGDGDGDMTGDGDGDPSGCIPVDPIEIAVPCEDLGIVVEPPYDQSYECYSLGPVPGVPLEWGGVNIHPEDDNTLIIGGNANTEPGQLWSVGVARDEDYHILGYADVPSEVFGPAEYNDGGVAYHPDGDLLFLARWPVNELGQLIPGNDVTDKVIDLDPFGVTNSLAGLEFVTPGFPGEGQLKFVTWATGDWYTVTLEPDNMGTYDISAVNYEVTVQGGPEGFVYISEQNPQFDVKSMLISEWSDNKIAAYEINDNGDPIVDTRVDFVTGLQGAEGAFIDPLSGDFMFTTFGGDDVLIAIRGFLPNPQ